MKKTEQKNVNLWLDKDLAKIFQKLNKQSNRSLLNHELEYCFHKYDVNYLVLYEKIEVKRSSFADSVRTIETISKIILRARFVNRELKSIVSGFNFIKTYI